MNHISIAFLAGGNVVIGKGSLTDSDEQISLTPEQWDELIRFCVHQNKLNTWVAPSHFFGGNDATMPF